MGSFHVAAHHSANSEGDHFTFAYSTNLVDWDPDPGAVQVAGATGPDGVQSVTVTLSRNS